MTPAFAVIASRSPGVRAGRSPVLAGEDLIRTPEGAELIRRPSGAWTIVHGRRARRKHLPASAVLAVLSEPDTVVITFKSGRTWLIKKLGKVDAASLDEAAAAYLDLAAAKEARR